MLVLKSRKSGNRKYSRGLEVLFNDLLKIRQLKLISFLATTTVDLATIAFSFLQNFVKTKKVTI